MSDIRMFSNDADNEIIRHWGSDDRELPGINAIFYADGTVTIMSFVKYQDSSTGQIRSIHCSPVCDTSIASIEKYDAAYWTSANISVEIEYHHGKLFGGCGDYEATGFIACEDEQENFVWAIFFEDSEPIQKIMIQDETIIAWGAAEWDAHLKITINSRNLTEIHMEEIPAKETSDEKTPVE